MTTSEKIQALLVEFGYHQTLNGNDLTEEWRAALRGLKASQIREIHDDWDGTAITLPSNFTKARRAWEKATGWKRPALPDATPMEEADSMTDQAFATWLYDVERLLLKTFSWQGKKDQKSYVGELIGHNPEVAWQDDPKDQYLGGGAKFVNMGDPPRAQFVELGPYWTRVRQVGFILAGVNLIRSWNRRPELPTTKTGPVSSKQFAEMVKSVKAHSQPTHDRSMVGQGSPGNEELFKERDRMAEVLPGEIAEEATRPLTAEDF